ncbi:MAG: phosphotransferase [Polyangiaceae bacterium]|nr:phosphotransferase [Polyangiaceae bacterium]
MADLDLAPLRALLHEAFGGEEAAITPMPGGASTRKFFRATTASGRAAVAFFVPDATRSDEIDKTDGARARWPFLEVQALLASRGIAVPRILADGSRDGWLLVEDLGDDTLAQYLAARPDARERCYQVAVRDLAAAQRALAELPEGSVVGQRAFDEDLLRWEIHHFREWALEARGVTLPAADRAIFDAVAERLARRIASWPRGFVHRDYQSRNLMVRDEAGAPALVWIDFQDALLGPGVYDLVALLNDSYQSFDRAFVEARLAEYARDAGRDVDEVVREFDLVTVQRKLKDAGRFVFIDREKGNPAFLQFVEPTIDKVRASLARLLHEPDMRALADVLARALPG